MGSIMANTNAPMGFIPRRYRNGSPWMGAVRTYYVPATDATAIFPGDPVIIAGDGDASGYPTVTRATAGASNRITGVCIGLRPGTNNTLIPPKYRAASVAEYILVADDPALLFEAQEIGTALAATNIDQNANITFGAGGNTFTGQSGAGIDTTTAATTNTLQVRLVEYQHGTDNEIGQYANWLVAFNQPTETGAAGSTGV